jgi:MoaA/NifB/PqqE/SkfB family radical SAM enzyme
MFGCTAGGTDRFYINAKGDVQPCEFLNISFGNIKEEPFENIYDRMRHEFHIPGDKWLCEEYAKDIHRIVVENDIKTFPLSVELSKQVIDNWERGKPSEFYEGVVKK